MEQTCGVKDKSVRFAKIFGTKKVFCRDILSIFEEEDHWVELEIETVKRVSWEKNIVGVPW